MYSACGTLDYTTLLVLKGTRAGIVSVVHPGAAVDVGQRAAADTGVEGEHDGRNEDAASHRYLITTSDLGARTDHAGTCTA